jgi:hypothetical protein
MSEDSKDYCAEALAQAGIIPFSKKKKPSTSKSSRAIGEGNGGVHRPLAWPDITEEGEPKRTYRNARVAIEALGITCRYDEFHDKMLVGGHAIKQWAGEISDAVTHVLRQLIINTYDFDPGKDHVSDAATELCLEHSFDPVKDYLDSLKWDGEPRVDKWLCTYLGAEDTPLNRAIGRLTLIAAVRRVRKPGTKFDHITTLEAPRER